MGMQLEKSVSVNVPFDLSHCSCFFIGRARFRFSYHRKSVDYTFIDSDFETVCVRVLSQVNREMKIP